MKNLLNDEINKYRIPYMDMIGDDKFGGDK